MKKDYAGLRYGKLVITSRFDEIQNGRYITKLIAKCDCGNNHVFDQKNVTHTNSCGCSKLRKSNQHYKNRVFSFYKKNAKRKGQDFEFEYDDFIEMTQQNCRYCDDPPSNNYKLADDGFEFKYNGIDRMDNSKGYVAGNVVPCCKPCNTMKSNFTFEEFLDKIQKIYRNWC